MCVCVCLYQARQTGDGVDPKESTMPLAVNLPGDVLNPVFSQTSYQGVVDEVTQQARRFPGK